MRIASLFSGCGGLDWGFHKNPHFALVFANDFDKQACRTYLYNFKGSEIYLKEGNISEFIEDIPPFDLLLGGFPCQPFTLAGKRKGFEDERGLQYKSCVQALKNQNSKYFIFENVGGLLSHNKGETLNVILQSFEEIGYKVHCELIKMEDYGIPQRRHRLFFFGVRKDLSVCPKEMIPKKPKFKKEDLLLKTILRKFPKITRDYEFCSHFNHNFHNGGRAKPHWIKILKEGENLKDISEGEILKREIEASLEFKIKPKTQQGYKRLNGEIVAPTMMFGNTCLPIHPIENRDLSVREVATIQGFPLDFRFLGGISHQYKQLGNAVPAQFSIILADHLVELLKEDK